MAEPRFIVESDNGDVSVEPDDTVTSVEGYDIREIRAFKLSGERLRPRLADDREWSAVSFIPTGEFAEGELVDALRQYVARTGLHLESTGDYLLDVANAIEAAAYEARWPKRPRWLATRLHGERPYRYSRA